MTASVLGLLLMFSSGVSLRGAADAVAVCDLNGDGRPDVAVAVSGSWEWALLINEGEGRLRQPVYSKAGTVPVAIACADLSGRGRSDVVLIPMAAKRGWVEQNLGVRYGEGNGFESKPFGNAAGMSGVAAADLNRDGRLDLAVTNAATDSLELFFGLGSGMLVEPDWEASGCGASIKEASSPSRCYATGKSPEAVAVGDFNGDGKPDLAVANGLDATVGIFLNKGDGTFRDMVAYPVGKGPIWIAVGDFDGDGKPDLAVADFYGEDEHGRLSLLRGKGDGTFEPELKLAAGPAPVAVVSADFDGDGRPDLAVAENGGGVGKTVTVLRGLGGMKFAAPVEVEVPQSPNALAVGDMDGNGKPDLVVATTQGLVILHNLGAKGFER